MLFKEKLLLSNCDSVRKLEFEELRKRVLVGLIFADGIILSPNVLMDNYRIIDIFGQKSIVKYLNEEGIGKFVVRGFNVEKLGNMQQYFYSLPENYIISSITGSPEKGSLSDMQRDNFLFKLDKLDKTISSCMPVYKDLPTNLSMTNNIFHRLSDADSLTHYFINNNQRTEFIEQTKMLVSRSDWYTFTAQYFSQSNTLLDAFKYEVINPAYNSLFVFNNEAFVQDDIKILSKIPEKILDTAIILKSIREEIELIEDLAKIIKIISLNGTDEICKYFADRAIDYIEDTMKKKGRQILTRKNWFGLYPKVVDWMGVELK